MRLGSRNSKVVEKTWRPRQEDFNGDIEQFYEFIYQRYGLSRHDIDEIERYYQQVERLGSFIQDPRFLSLLSDY